MGLERLGRSEGQDLLSESALGRKGTASACLRKHRGLEKFFGMTHIEFGSTWHSGKINCRGMWVVADCTLARIIDNPKRESVSEGPAIKSLAYASGYEKQSLIEL